MASLTDYIEEYLKKMLTLTSNHYIEIRRRELAKKFSCVPSQINYVLDRRFTLEQGYLVESRRGGAGFIRIYRIRPEQARPWQQVLDDLNEDTFDPPRVRKLLLRLVEENVLSRREAAVLNAVVDEELYYESCAGEENLSRLQLNIFMSALKQILKTGY